MKKHLFTTVILFCFLIGYSQEFKDRIYTKAKDTIICDITNVTNNWITYNYSSSNKIKEKSISTDDVNSYIKDSQIHNNRLSEKKDSLITKAFYCEIVGTSKMFSQQVTVSIDYGQQTKLFQDTRIRDENGKIQSFNSMIDALNYMGSQGWEFVQAYIVTTGNQNVYHYLLKRNK